MDFSYSAKQLEYIDRINRFMDEHIYPNADIFHQQTTDMDPKAWKIPQIIEDMKEKAKAAGLWNLFLPPSEHETDDYRGAGLTNLEYAPLAEITGRAEWAPEVFNCSAPDTGNMEVLLRFGSTEQKARWLKPLMAGTIRSAFLMTEPFVASSDATNVETSIIQDGDEWVINGRKWWSSGLGDPRCKVAIVMGKTDRDAPQHLQQSMVLVPLDTPGIRIVRMLPVFGWDDAPHGHAEVVLENVRVPLDSIILGPGRGFEIAQGRLGPGRIHHCMRTIGTAQLALEKMADRLQSRHAFGKPIADHSVWETRVADARIDIEMARLLTLRAADRMDKIGNKDARLDIAMIKVAAPRMALQIIDDAIQAHGGGGVSNDFGLARAYGSIRALRLADGPDEVHQRTIARIEYKQSRQATTKSA